MNVEGNVISHKRYKSATYTPARSRSVSLSFDIPNKSFVPSLFVLSRNFQNYFLRPRANRVRKRERERILVLADLCVRPLLHARGLLDRGQRISTGGERANRASEGGREGVSKKSGIDFPHFTRSFLYGFVKRPRGLRERRFPPNEIFYIRALAAIARLRFCPYV